MQNDIASIRREYCLKELSRSSVDNNPVVQFRNWLDEAIAAQVTDPTAMGLSTAGTDGRPSSRIVLLKDINERGLSFFSSYESRKAEQLIDNDYAALLFYWPELERQVRFEGTVEKVAAAESDEYFNSRPEASRIGAWASRQSSVIGTRSELVQEFEKIADRFGKASIPRPPYWGGYRLLPLMAEFWQGRPGRLHDRIRYLLKDEGWQIDRLSP
jgi:pyridoxamine 5'-phosphate oxidase